MSLRVNYIAGSLFSVSCYFHIKQHNLNYIKLATKHIIVNHTISAFDLVGVWSTARSENYPS